MKKCKLLLCIASLLIVACCLLSSCDIKIQSLIDDFSDSVLDNENSSNRSELMDGEKIKQLECVSFPLHYAEYFGDGKAIGVSFDYYSEDPETTIYMIDLVNDEIVGEYTAGGICDISTECFSSGNIYLKDTDNSVVIHLTDSLEYNGQFEAADTLGYFSADGKYYYYCDTDDILKYSVDEKTTEVVSPDISLDICSIYGYCPETSDISCEVLVGFDSCVFSMAIINCETGRVELLSNDYSFVAPFSDSFVGVAQIDDRNSYLWRSTESDDISYSIPDDSQECEISQIFNAPMFFRKIDGVLSIITFDDYGAYSTDIINDETDYNVNSVSYLESENVMMLSVDIGGVAKCFMYDATRLSKRTQVEEYYSVISSPFIKDELVEIAEDEKYIPPIKQDLENLREYADSIEESYGITILLSNQCMDGAYLPEDSVFVSTEEYYDGIDAEYEAIRSFLEILDNTASQFPEGFLSQFRTKQGEAGIKMLLTGPITMDDDFEADGLSWSMGKWHYEAFDITSETPHDTICHEIFHSIDEKLLNNDPLWNESWSELNPEGFEYCENFDNYLDETDYNYYTSYDNDWYFVDEYSHVNIQEDMARVFEAATSEDEYFSNDVFESDKMLEKLSFIDANIREIFVVDETYGTAFWAKHIR